MPKKDAKILQFPGPSSQSPNAKPQPQGPKQGPKQGAGPTIARQQADGAWRLQPSAIFWHVLAFLFPSFAVWQGLYAHWEIWYSIIISLLFMAFFLFFLPQNRLELLTQEAKKVSFWRKMWNARHVRGPSLKAPPASSSIFGVASPFANDGKGTWNAVPNEDDDDDGATIEDYLQQRKQGDSAASIEQQKFDWNWQAQQDNEDDALGHFADYEADYKREPFSLSAFCARSYKALLQFWQENWSLAWRTHLGGAVSMPMFWLSSLAWGPLLYWGATDSVGLQQRLGLSSFGSLLFALLLWNLLFPLLEQQQKRKLFCALGEQRSVYANWLAKTDILGETQSDGLIRLPLFLRLAIEIGSSLALALLLWPILSSAAVLGLSALLLIASTWLRMSLLWRSEGEPSLSFPLYLYRLLSCLSASAALLFAQLL